MIDGPSSVPPGSVAPALYRQFRQLVDETIPPSIRPLVDSPREEISIQPVYDESVERYVSGRTALIGDAGTLSRPHTGSGATKAMQDARCIEQRGKRGIVGCDHYDFFATLFAVAKCYSSDSCV